MAEAQANPVQRIGGFLQRWADWLLGLGVLGLVVVLIVPVAPAVLDVLLAINLAASLLLLLLTLNAKRSIELSTFPAILLFTTLFRLGLNIASTRLIMTHGEGGEMIRAFGEYVGGAHLAVGIVVFLLLVVIQFIVITKGSGRISEVAARFVLDAMPGKQMAIDADLNAGMIDADEARARRTAVAREAEFHGAMDGASKFVRGDAIAGLVITAINLIGGIAFGTFKGLSLSEAVDRYSKLTIGDGLVSQIPALLVSTAAAVLVTKENSGSSLGTSLLDQVSGSPRAARIAAGMLGVIGFLPGIPAVPFLVLAGALLWIGRRGAAQAAAAEAERAQGAEAAAGAAASGPDDLAELLQVDRVSLEIGYRLVPLVQESGGGLLEHIARLRRKIAQEQGLQLPPVRVRDNVRLAPNSYRILVGGSEVARGEVEPGMWLAMDQGQDGGKLEGKPAKDPAFGLPATWVAAARRDEAESRGFVTVDAASVLATHLSEVLHNQLGELVTRDDVKALLDGVKRTAPAVVEEIVPSKMSYGDVQRVLRGLLREGVPIRNLPAILEALADASARTKETEPLVEAVRQRLARTIVERHADREGTLHAVTLDPQVEVRLAAALSGGRDAEAAAATPAWMHALMERTAASVAQAAKGGKDIVLVVRSNVRRFVHELVHASMPKVSVLSYNEIQPARSVRTAATIRLEEVR
ncbi:MAG: flagellar biosynthesis protein FlhA [Planctomycetes bacterium]|nr:flagellar biosynthesis protein FlhA [Planctomycetota bacterium]